MTSGSQVSTFSEAVSYDRTAVKLSLIIPTNHPTTGSASFTTFGVGFGKQDYSSKARKGFTASEGTSWHSETSMSVLPAAGLRPTLALAISSTGVVGTVTHAASFDLPRLYDSSQNRGVGLLAITNNGTRYIDGDLHSEGGEGSGFKGRFNVDWHGRIVSTTIVFSGEYFFFDPNIILTYKNSLLSQNNSVTDFDIIEDGSGYIDGDLIPEGGGGSGASAKFEVNALGAIVTTFFENVTNHGGGFTTEPFVQIFFASSRYNQTSSITFVEIQHPGHNYVAGNLMALSGTGESFFGTFSIRDGGKIAETAIAPSQHGSGYISGQVEVVIVYAGTNLSQTNSIASIQIHRSGQNFVPGQLRLIGGYGSGFLGSFTTNHMNGSIDEIFISALSHGIDFHEEPTSVDICYPTTSDSPCLLQNGYLCGSLIALVKCIFKLP